MKFIAAGVFLCSVWWNPPVNCKRYHQHVGLGEPNTSENNIGMEFEDKWFLQNLNHFDSTDNRTWRQRYQVNSNHYQKDGPVFLMIGGEGEISDKWMYSGEWINYAGEFNALCFQLEHRYYGKSHPTEDLSTKNLVYLSSEQALADLAKFIVDIPAKYQVPSTAKWVAFGGSYPGSLAAWLRMKYPHLVHAAVSSSGPLLAKVDFREFFAVVEDALAEYKPECVSQIKQANQMIYRLLETDEGSKILDKKFKLCDSLNKNNKKDVSVLFETLAESFGEIVQYNKDNQLGLSVTLEDLCDIMVNESIKNPLDRYAAVNDKWLSVNNLSCTDCIYTNAIESLKNTSWNSEAADGGRQWTYQTCTEFGFYPSSCQHDHTFSSQFPVTFFIDICTDIFGKKFNSELLAEAVKRTNTMYGGLHVIESRVIYVQGSVDPWHALGITRTKTANTVAIYIEGTAHCADMYPSSPKDLPQLTKARRIIREFLCKWLSESDSVGASRANNIKLTF